jgi:hypothetical protein
MSNIRLPTFRLNMVPFLGPIFLRVLDLVDEGRVLLRNIVSPLPVDTAVRVRRFEYEPITF